jgi:hypothetical protein
MNTAISRHTEGKARLEVIDLVARIGSQPHPEVPIRCRKAEVELRPGEPVLVRYECYVSEETFKRLAPDLAATEQRLRDERAAADQQSGGAASS